MEHPRQADSLHQSLEVSSVKYFLFSKMFSELPPTVSSTSLGPLAMFRATTSVTRSSSPRPTVRTFEKLQDNISLCTDNCVRQEKGYCRIQWKENSVSSPDPFQLDTQTGGSTLAAGGATPAAAVTCALAYVTIPEGSETGVSALNPTLSGFTYQTTWCGANLGYTPLAASMNVICKSQSI